MEVKLLNSLAKLPRRASAGAAGYDITSTEHVTIYPGTRGLVSTGVSVKLPPGVYGRIAPRSGLAVKNGIQVGAGVIDADYRGEIKVLLFNHSSDHLFEVSPGDRIAQLICERCELPDVIQTDELDETERGEGKFGSTGR
jgi:dUTP pyrophosphatase